MGSPGWMAGVGVGELEMGRTEIGEPTTTSSCGPSEHRTASPVPARCGSARISPGPSTGSQATPTARSSVIHSARGLVTKNDPQCLARSRSLPVVWSL